MGNVHVIERSERRGSEGGRPRGSRGVMRAALEGGGNDQRGDPEAWAHGNGPSTGDLRRQRRAGLGGLPGPFRSEGRSCTTASRLAISRSRDGGGSRSW